MATASRHVSLTGYILPRSNSSDSSTPPHRDLEVGELQGAKFKIEPLRRTGEDAATTRARLLCEFAPAPRFLAIGVLTTT
jgi:hypothetical protein